MLLREYYQQFLSDGKVLMASPLSSARQRDGLSRFDVCPLHDRPPFLDLGLLDGSECLSRELIARRNLRTEIGKPRTYRRIGQRSPRVTQCVVGKRSITLTQMMLTVPTASIVAFKSSRILCGASVRNWPEAEIGGFAYPRARNLERGENFHFSKTLSRRRTPRRRDGPQTASCVGFEVP